MIGPIRWGRFGEHTPIEVSQVSLGFARLPRAFDGFRIALLSDLHYGRFVRADYVRRVFRLVGEHRPDLVVLCGDMLSRGGRRADRVAALLGESCGDLQIYAVLGNHERAADAQGICRSFRAVGVEFLINRHHLISRPGESAGADPEVIALAGVDDLWARRANPRAALGGIQDGTFTILAAHNPDLADRLGKRFRIDLMLCGHTHGGQIRLFGRSPITETENPRYVSGLTDGPNFPLYISRGLGVVGVPLRIACDPELPIITLRRDAGNS